MNKRRSKSKSSSSQKEFKDGLKMEDGKDEPMVVDCFDQSSGGGDGTQVSNADTIIVDSPVEEDEASTSKEKSKKQRKRSPSPVFTLRRDMNEPLKNFSDCDTLYHGYVPSLKSGDVIEWKTVDVKPKSGPGSSCSKKGVENGNSSNSKDEDQADGNNSSPIKNPAGDIDSKDKTYHLLSAVCKGCKESFAINNNNSLLKIYLNHCIKECPKYQALDRIKCCDPCSLYCMDKKAFVDHGKSDPNCPMFDSFNFWHKRQGRPRKSSSTKE